MSKEKEKLDSNHSDQGKESNKAPVLPLMAPGLLQQPPGHSACHPTPAAKLTPFQPQADILQHVLTGSLC